MEIFEVRSYQISEGGIDEWAALMEDQFIP